MRRLTENHMETLRAVERVANGSWEFISVPCVKECMARGWIFQSPDRRLRLTEEGREILRSISGVADSLSGFFGEETEPHCLVTS